VRMKEGLET